MVEAKIGGDKVNGQIEMARRKAPTLGPPLFEPEPQSRRPDYQGREKRERRGGVVVVAGVGGSARIRIINSANWRFH
jgi:hypothetical protein